MKGMGQVSIWFREPIRVPSTICPFTNIEILEHWDCLSGPTPNHISGYHISETYTGGRIWDMVIQSQEKPMEEWKDTELPIDSPNHYKNWILELNIDFFLT